MNLTHEERLSRIHLIEELDLSVSVIKHGLAILQRSSAAQTRYFLFMLTLSTGIERLMKVLLCLHSLGLLANGKPGSLGQNEARLRLG